MRTHEPIGSTGDIRGGISYVRRRVSPGNAVPPWPASEVACKPHHGPNLAIKSQDTRAANNWAARTSYVFAWYSGRRCGTSAGPRASKRCPRRGRRPAAHPWLRFL